MEFKEVKDRAEALFSLQKEYEEAKRFSSDLYNEFKRKEEELGEILLDHELTKIVVTNGTFSIVREDNYEVSDYEKFRTYLYNTGNSHLLTVHSGRLKAFLKEEYERGIDIEGVEKTDSRNTYKLTKSK